MNVKANMLIGQEDWVEELFAFPSCGDESKRGGRGLPRIPRGMRAADEWRDGLQPFGPAYLGPSVTDEDAEAVIRERGLEGRYKIGFHDRIEEKIAELLVSDGVVARCAGRMEFGARALGNRYDPRQPVGPVGWAAHQPDDQEPRFTGCPSQPTILAEARRRTTCSTRNSMPRPT